MLKKDDDRFSWKYNRQIRNKVTWRKNNQATRLKEWELVLFKVDWSECHESKYVSGGIN